MDDVENGVSQDPPIAPDTPTPRRDRSASAAAGAAVIVMATAAIGLVIVRATAVNHNAHVSVRSSDAQSGYVSCVLDPVRVHLPPMTPPQQIAAPLLPLHVYNGTGQYSITVEGDGSQD